MPEKSKIEVPKSNGVIKGESSTFSPIITCVGNTGLWWYTMKTHTRDSAIFQGEVLQEPDPLTPTSPMLCGSKDEPVGVAPNFLQSISDQDEKAGRQVKRVFYDEQRRNKHIRRNTHIKETPILDKMHSRLDGSTKNHEYLIWKS